MLNSNVTSAYVAADTVTLNNAKSYCDNEFTIRFGKIYYIYANDQTSSGMPTEKVFFDKLVKYVKNLGFTYNGETRIYDIVRNSYAHYTTIIQRLISEYYTIVLFPQGDGNRNTNYVCNIENDSYFVKTFTTTLYTPTTS